jgi:dTDP-4-amino-4,6-dideoxygalactose transaminase
MIYSYYNPNLKLSVALKSLFRSSKKAEEEIIDYFRKLTGKRYVLITNSCRTALFLAYKAIGREGEVISSPLTCKVAIDPIIESGNQIVYADINFEDLNIDPNDIEHRITSKTIAIQAIHFGGNSCDIDRIRNIAKRHHLSVIEDCAQSLGASYDGKYTGAYGDIACFSLIKNAYGIGGGILATDSKTVYHKALSIIEGLPVISPRLLLFRLIRNTVETYRKTVIGGITYQMLMKLKGDVVSYSSVEDQLRKISNIQIKISATQIARFPVLHQKRKRVGQLYYQLLSDSGFLMNSDYNPENSSFTKFFIYNPEIDTRNLLEKLHNQRIEAMHLEHKQGSPYQFMLISDKKLAKSLKKYFRIHDHIISLPLIESLNKQDIEFINESVLKNV